MVHRDLVEWELWVCSEDCLELVEEDLAWADLWVVQWEARWEGQWVDQWDLDLLDSEALQVIILKTSLLTQLAQRP